MGIILRNVGIFEEKIGGDKWGFLIAEVGISTLNFLAALVAVLNCKQIIKQAENSEENFICVAKLQVKLKL